jgi:hypothetical protein
MRSGCIEPCSLDLGTRRRWVVSFTIRSLHPRERAPGTHWTGGCVDPRAGLDAVKRKISCPCGKSNHGRPARSLSLYWLSHPGSPYFIVLFYCPRKIMVHVYSEVGFSHTLTWKYEILLFSKYVNYYVSVCIEGGISQSEPCTVRVIKSWIWARYVVRLTKSRNACWMLAEERRLEENSLDIQRPCEDNIKVNSTVKGREMWLDIMFNSEVRC